MQAGIHASGLFFAEGMFWGRKRSNYTWLLRVTLRRSVGFISALHMGSSSWRGLNLTEELLLMSFPRSFCLTWGSIIRVSSCVTFKIKTKCSDLSPDRY